MWKDLVEQEDKWIGGTLVDYGDRLDRLIAGKQPAKTKIMGFLLTRKHFTVNGLEFDCGGSRELLAIPASPEFDCDEPGIAIRGYGGHEFHIHPRTQGGGNRGEEGAKEG